MHWSCLFRQGCHHQAPGTTTGTTNAATTDCGVEPSAASAAAPPQGDELSIGGEPPEGGWGTKKMISPQMLQQFLLTYWTFNSPRRGIICASRDNFVCANFPSKRGWDNIGRNADPTPWASCAPRGIVSGSQIIHKSVGGNNVGPNADTLPVGSCTYRGIISGSEFTHKNVVGIISVATPTYNTY